jgi:molybdenum cofactor cytidylyltransferase
MIRVGLVLAAGRSTRFGAANKLLAPFRGAPLARHCAKAMRQAEVEHRIAVAADPGVGDLFAGFRVVTMPDPSAPQSDSLKQGLRVARALGADRVLVALADMPLIGPDTLNAVLHACTGSTASAVTDGARRMPPACFPRALFGALELLTGDRGAGPLLRTISPDGLVRVSPECLTDVDTAADISHKHDDI